MQGAEPYIPDLTDIFNTIGILSSTSTYHYKPLPTNIFAQDSSRFLLFLYIQTCHGLHKLQLAKQPGSQELATKKHSCWLVRTSIIYPLYSAGPFSTSKKILWHSFLLAEQELSGTGQFVQTYQNIYQAGHAIQQQQQLYETIELE